MSCSTTTTTTTTTGCDALSGCVFEDTQLDLMMRITARQATGDASPFECEGILLKSDDVVSVEVSAWDRDGVQIGATYSPSTSSVIYNTLQTTGIWENVADGGNFLVTCPAYFFPTGKSKVSVKIILTLTDGSTIPSLWKISVRDLPGQ